MTNNRLINFECVIIILTKLLFGQTVTAKKLPSPAALRHCNIFMLSLGSDFGLGLEKCVRVYEQECVFVGSVSPVRVLTRLVQTWDARIKIIIRRVVKEYVCLSTELELHSNPIKK